MIEHCWLHIGTEKTGTTSIQSFLASNRAALTAQGYLFPEAPGRMNHLGLTCYALDDEKVESVRRGFGVTRPDEVTRYRSTLATLLANETSAARVSSLVFSNEHLSSRLRTLSEVRRIRELCSTFARRTTVIVYLRNQIDFLVSRYIESIKGGSTAPFPIPIREASARLMDYAALLAPWREVFGVENLCVRRYETDDYPCGDVLRDFAVQVGFDPLGFVFPDRSNEALDAPSVAFLREFNKHVPPFDGDRRNALRGRVVKELEAARSAERFRISPEIACAIDDRFRASNERVSAEYFGSRHDPLFGPARSINLAGDAESGELDASQGVRLAAHLWASQQRQLLKLEGDLARLRAGTRSSQSNLAEEPSPGSGVEDV